MACSLKDLINCFMQLSPLYTLCLLSMLLYDDNVDIEKPDEICLLTFVVDYFFRSIFTYINPFY